MSILDLSFNQNGTLLSCATTKGFIQYSIKKDIKKCLVSNLSGGVGKIYNLSNSNVAVLSGGGNNPFKPKNVVALWVEDKKTSMLELDIKQEVKNIYIVKVNDSIMIVAVKEKGIMIFNTEADHLFTKETFKNETGLCDVRESKFVIATLGLNKGEIAIWHPNLKKYKSIVAHAGKIAALVLNDDGSLVATASENGTNIHVYDTKSCKQLYKLRRGTDILSSTIIYDMCFGKNSKLLACCSSRGTIHVFDISGKDSAKNKVKEKETNTKKDAEISKEKINKNKVDADDANKADVDEDKINKDNVKK